MNNSVSMALVEGTRVVLHYYFSLYRTLDPYFGISLMFGELCFYCIFQCSIGGSFYAVTTAGCFPRLLIYTDGNSFVELAQMMFNLNGSLVSFPELGSSSKVLLNS